MVFAFCELDDINYETNSIIKTTIVTLVREHKKLSDEKQIKLLQDIAVNLGERKFLAAQLQINTCNNASSINSGFLCAITFLLILSKIYFV
jgi:hypothetical protein